MCSVMLAVAIGIGISSGNNWYFIFIDKFNRLSLARLQITLWSFLLISLILSIALLKQTMNIVIAQELWALLGISVGSKAGSIAIESAKNKNGNLHVRLESKSPSLLDLFMGEESTDHEYIDIGKFQMFWFTIAVFVGYIWILLDWDVQPNQAGEYVLPVMHGGLLVILAISHAGYIVMKATPK